MFQPNNLCFPEESIGGSREGSGNFSFEPQVSPREASPGFDQLNSEIEEARAQSQARRQTIQDKIAKKERKKDKKKKKGSKGSSENSDYNSSGMSEIEEVTNGGAKPKIPAEMLPSEQALEDEAQERLAEEEKKKNRDPPIVFKEIDAKLELESLVNLVDGVLTEEEKISLEELHQYLLLGEGSWALGDGFLDFVGRIFRDKTLSTEVRVHLIRALAAAALKDDIILILHQDRKDHVLMNFAQDVDRHPPEEQQALALFVS